MNNSQKNIYFVSGAIIIAGLLIAAAIIYSQRPKETTQQDNGPQIVPEKRDGINIDIKGWPSKGDPNSPVLMVEYSDFACSFCARFWQQTLPEIEKEYIDTGKVHFVYKDFIVVGGDRAAEAAHCAAEQGKFWEYHDILFLRLDEDRGKWSNSDIHREYAQELNLNVNELIGCFEERRYQDKVQGSTQEGIENGVTGTPAFFINGILVSGAQPFQVFQEAIEQELANRQ